MSTDERTLLTCDGKGIDAKRQALDRLLAQAKPQWQPIETAPKDGTRVLLWAKGRSHMRTGYYDDSLQIGNYPNWRWGVTIEPTHWMPLPEPPTNKE